MRKEDAIAISHLVDSMQDAVNRLEISKKENEKEGFENAKKEVLDIQKRINSLLR